MRRYTDTEKWSETAFRVLPPEIKLAWLYILDKADRAGFWVPEFDVLNMRLGVSLDKGETLQSLGSLVFVHGSGVWQIKNWFLIQYPQKPGVTKRNGVAQSAWDDLERAAALLGPQVFQIANSFLGKSGTPGVPQETEKETEAEAVRSRRLDENPSDALAMAVLHGAAAKVGLAWPAKVPAADEALAVALAEAHGATRLADALTVYAGRFLGPKSLHNFLQHADTWLNTAPPTPAQCRHEYKPKVRKLDEWTLGEIETFQSCTRCSHEKPNSAVRSRPHCEHQWHDVDVAEANVVRQRMGLDLIEPTQQCKECGVERKAEGVLS